MIMQNTTSQEAREIMPGIEAIQDACKTTKYLPSEILKDNGGALTSQKFKELIRKVKSKGGTNVVLTNQWSDEFDPNEYENSTYPDSDGDGVDDYDESLLGLDGKPIGV